MFEEIIDEETLLIEGGGWLTWVGVGVAALGVAAICAAGLPAAISLITGAFASFDVDGIAIMVGGAIAAVAGTGAILGDQIS